LIKGEKKEAGFFPLGKGGEIIGWLLSSFGKGGEIIGWLLSPFGKGGQGEFASSFLDDIISPTFF
jgi:hypothetical protein